MSVLTAFAKGTRRIWINKRLVVWLYLVNVAFAAVLVYPFRKLVGKLGRTDLAGEFLSGFPVDTAAEFWSKHSVSFKSLGYAAAGLGVLYLLVNVFLTGGIVAALAVDRRVSLRRFFNDASRYFGRYVRLFVLLAAVIGLAAWGHTKWVSEYVEDLREQSLTGRASFLTRAAVVATWLVLFAFTLMVFDYARIRTVVERRRSIFVATLMALGFSVRRFWKSIPLFALNLLVVGVLFGTYLTVEGLFSEATLFSLVCLFVIQQLLILSRIWMRLSFYSTQLAYFQSVRG